MPKTKTHKGISKRVRITGKGKIVKESANRQHLFEHKSSRRTRRLDGTSSVSKADVRKIKKLLKI